MQEHAEPTSVEYRPSSLVIRLIGLYQVVAGVVFLYWLALVPSTLIKPSPHNVIFLGLAAGSILAGVLLLAVTRIGLSASLFIQLIQCFVFTGFGIRYWIAMGLGLPHLLARLDDLQR